MGKKKAAHGGARAGAGRKPSPEGKAVTIAVTVPEGLAATLRERADAEGWGMSRAVTEAIRAYIARKR